MEYYEFKKEDAYEFARVSGIQSKQRGDELQLLSCPYCRGGKNGDKGTFSISLVTGQFNVSDPPVLFRGIWLRLPETLIISV